MSVSDVRFYKGVNSYNSIKIASSTCGLEVWNQRKRTCRVGWNRKISSIISFFAEKFRDRQETWHLLVWLPRIRHISKPFFVSQMHAKIYPKSFPFDLGRGDHMFSSTEGFKYFFVFAGRPSCHLNKKLELIKSTPACLRPDDKFYFFSSLTWNIEGKLPDKGGNQLPCKAGATQTRTGKGPRYRHNKMPE